MNVSRAIRLGFCCTVLAFGQAQISSGDIRGTVVDASGGAIPKATVTVLNPDRGFSRNAPVNEAGDGHFALLAPGGYRLRVEAPGFATQVIDGITVRVGDTVALQPVLEVSALATEVNVAAEVSVVETERTQQANTIEWQRIQNLPINRRNYLEFALLAPGVVETNDMVDGTDFRVVQTPHSGLSFGGSNGRGNAFSIDGIENFYTSGGVRPSLSQEAVLEFQINRNSYSAELGGAFGGAINIVSRSGSNDLHGSLFGFLRHRDIQARNFFDPGKSAFTRGQYGAAAGGPLRRDRTFFFAAFERLDRRETGFVPILQDRSAFGRLTPSQQQLADFFDASGSPQLRGLAAAMRQALIPSNSPRTVELFNRNSGNFPFSEDSNQVSLRLDHRFSDHHSAFLRGNLTKSLSQNAQFGALIAFNRGRSIGLLDGTWMINDTYVWSPRWVSETRAAFSYDHLDVLPTDRIGPEINITGFGFFGREIFLPSKTWERHWQFQHTVSRVTGQHNVKFGTDINPVRDTVRSETFFSGRFSFGENVPLAAVLNAAAGDPNFATGLAQTLGALGQQRLIPNVTAPISALQAYSLGFPTFYQQGFGDPNWIGWAKRYNFFVQDAWRVHPRLTVSLGARYELEVNEEVVGTDGNDVAPRVGLAWTPDANTVIRAGFGLYYSQTNAQVPNVAETLAGTQIAQVFVPLSGAPGLNNPLTGRPLTSADIYQRLLAQGVIGWRSITRDDLLQFGLRPGPNLPFAVVFGIVPDFVNPYAEQASFEVERALGSFALSAGYNFNRAAHIVRILDRNLFYSGRRPDGQPTFGFYNPLVFQRNIFESTGNSFYHALTLHVNRRYSRHFALNAHYTFSKAMDEVTDFNTDFQPHDQLNARAERALSAFHQAHRFVANAVLESPLRGGVLGDFTLSPILIASSGRPFNVLAGFDNLGDRHPNTHRPLDAGRNLGKGPDFFTVDLRLSRKFRWGREERNSVEVIGEGFNLLNRTNFKSLNNTVGDVKLADLPRPLVGRPGVPTTPLSFTSTFDPRQFQLGLRINF